MSCTSPACLTPEVPAFPAGSTAEGSLSVFGGGRPQPAQSRGGNSTHRLAGRNPSRYPRAPTRTDQSPAPAKPQWRPQGAWAGMPEPQVRSCSNEHITQAMPRPPGPTVPGHVWVSGQGRPGGSAHCSAGPLYPTLAPWPPTFSSRVGGRRSSDRSETAAVAGSCWKSLQSVPLLTGRGTWPLCRVTGVRPKQHRLSILLPPW